MTAEQIRTAMSETCNNITGGKITQDASAIALSVDLAKLLMLSEVAAQLAELNQMLRDARDEELKATP
jgi:hypothetical protein